MNTQQIILNELRQVNNDELRQSELRTRAAIDANPSTTKKKYVKQKVDACPLLAITHKEDEQGRQCHASKTTE